MSSSSLSNTSTRCSCSLCCVQPRLYAFIAVSQVFSAFTNCLNCTLQSVYARSCNLTSSAVRTFISCACRYAVSATSRSSSESSNVLSAVLLSFFSLISSMDHCCKSISTSLISICNVSKSSLSCSMYLVSSSLPSGNSSSINSRPKSLRTGLSYFSCSAYPLRQSCVACAIGNRMKFPMLKSFSISSHSSSERSTLKSSVLPGGKKSCSSSVYLSPSTGRSTNGSNSAYSEIVPPSAYSLVHLKS